MIIKVKNLDLNKAKVGNEAKYIYVIENDVLEGNEQALPTERATIEIRPITLADQFAFTKAQDPDFYPNLIKERLIAINNYGMEDEFENITEVKTAEDLLSYIINPELKNLQDLMAFVIKKIMGSGEVNKDEEKN